MRNPTKSIYFSNTYNNTIWASKIEGDAEYQQQQHTPDEINYTTHVTIANTIHTSSYEGGTVNNSQT